MFADQLPFRDTVWEICQGKVTRHPLSSDVSVLMGFNVSVFGTTSTDGPGRGLFMFRSCQMRSGHGKWFKESPNCISDMRVAEVRQMAAHKMRVKDFLCELTDTGNIPEWGTGRFCGTAN